MDPFTLGQTPMSQKDATKTNSHLYPQTVKTCGNCGGSGSLVIKNAYDLTFEAVEVCLVCNGTGYVIEEEKSFGPN